MTGAAVVHAARCADCGRAVSLTEPPRPGARPVCVECFCRGLSPEKAAFVLDKLQIIQRIAAARNGGAS